jgi:hypothetical protein
MRLGCFNDDGSPKKMPIISSRKEWTNLLRVFKTVNFKVGGRERPPHMV